jgi:hypothetical protein
VKESEARQRSKRAVGMEQERNLAPVLVYFMSTVFYLL